MVREPRTTASPYTPPCWRWASTSSSFGPRVLLFYHVDHSLEFAEWDPRFKHRRLQRGLRRATCHGPPAWGKKSFLLQVNNFFTWDLSKIWLKPDYNSRLNPLLDQAEEAQYCQWTTVAIQSQSCVFQKSKAAQVIHSFWFLCWASLITKCFIALGAQGKLRARSQKYLSKSSMRPSCKMTFTSIW